LRDERTLYLVLTDKSTVIGQYDSKADAEKEAAYYLHETGKHAFVDEVIMFTKEEVDA
jgi:hypothetical protein